jgi:TonB family protein
MRHKGVEAEVVLKIEISEQGDVVDVQVVRGDEPFLTAAIAAVKTWKYSPAVDDGTPVASTRVVKIPFRLNAR